MTETSIVYPLLRDIQKLLISALYRWTSRHATDVALIPHQNPGEWKELENTILNFVAFGAY